jgi:hypothetical protein
MKCHWCKKDLVEFHIDTFRAGWLECPDSHISIRLAGKDIVEYVLYWDADIEAKTRYKLVSKGRVTEVLIKSPKTKNYTLGLYTKIMDIDPALTLFVKDDVIQFGNLIARLQKMKVFA